MIVDKEAFARIECNRCGQCCEWFTINLAGGPLGLFERYGRAEFFGYDLSSFGPLNFMTFTGQLEPQWDEERERWVYRCGYITAEGCGVYDRRPEMCRNFPNGTTVNYYDRCAWNVEVVDYEVCA